MSRNYMSRNDELRRGDLLTSNNGKFKAIFQDDGNFVIYGWAPTWASDTCGSDAFRLCMQADCNLVLYNKNGDARWHTNTAKDDSNMCHLYLTDEGKLMLSKDGKEIWNSDINKGKK